MDSCKRTRVKKGKLYRDIINRWIVLTSLRHKRVSKSNRTSENTENHYYKAWITHKWLQTYGKHLTTQFNLYITCGMFVPNVQVWDKKYSHECTISVTSIRYITMYNCLHKDLTLKYFKVNNDEKYSECFN